MGTNAKVLLQLSKEHHSFDRWSGGMYRADVGEQLERRIQRGPDKRDHRVLGRARRRELRAAAAPRTRAGGGGWVDPRGDRRGRPGVGAAFNGRAWLDSWVDDPWARGSYAAYLPGQYTRFAGSSGLAEGSIHFAGEHTSVFSQGFLNGGVESGSRAAIEVLEAIGVPLPPLLREITRTATRYEPSYPFRPS